MSRVRTRIRSVEFLQFFPYLLRHIMIVHVRSTEVIFFTSMKHYFLTSRSSYIVQLREHNIFCDIAFVNSTSLGIKRPRVISEYFLSFKTKPFMSECDNYYVTSIRLKNAHRARTWNNVKTQSSIEINFSQVSVPRIA